MTVSIHMRQLQYSLGRSWSTVGAALPTTASQTLSYRTHPHAHVLCMSVHLSLHHMITIHTPTVRTARQHLPRSSGCLNQTKTHTLLTRLQFLYSLNSHSCIWTIEALFRYPTNNAVFILKPVKNKNKQKKK